MLGLRNSVGSGKAGGWVRKRDTDRAHSWAYVCDSRGRTRVMMNGSAWGNVVASPHRILSQNDSMG